MKNVNTVHIGISREGFSRVEADKTYFLNVRPCFLYMLRERTQVDMRSKL